MLLSAATWRALYDHPFLAALFQIVSKLHACVATGAALRTDFHFCFGLATDDSRLRDGDIHRAHVQTLQRVQVVDYAEANCFLVVRLRFARTDKQKRGAKQGCQQNALHSKFLSWSASSAERGAERGLAVFYGNGVNGECNPASPAFITRGKPNSRRLTIKKFFRA